MFHNSSIFAKLGTLGVLSVILVMSVVTPFNYQLARSEGEQYVRHHVETSIAALSVNLTGFIDAFQPNEYEKLLEAELRSGKHQNLAILVNDRRMASILGSKDHINGRLRLPDGTISLYDPLNQQHAEILKSAFLSASRKISLGEEVIGEVTLYVTDIELTEMLKRSLLKDLLTGLGIAISLLVLLFFFANTYLVRPLGQIMRGFREYDDEGIPLRPFDENGPREIGLLAGLMNRGLRLIRESRQQLLDKHRELAAERERFQLAIDGTLDGLWDWDLLTGRVYHSERFSRMLGYEPGELPDNASCWKELVHLDDRKHAREILKRYLASSGQSTYENTFRMRTKAGEWRWITARGKAHFDKQGRAVRFVGFNTDVTRLIRQQQELAENQQSLQYQATHDPLTGLANRALLMDRLRHSIQKAERDNAKLALMFIDLDHFKSINDSLGHLMGDRVLKVVTRRLSKTIRAVDTLARLGGDEFTVIVENIQKAQDASLLAEKIINRIEQKISIDGHDMFLGCSIGISVYPDNGLNVEDILKNADAAMYRAKNSGRNNFQYYSVEMTDQAFDRLSMEANLRKGLRRNEFMVYYQPQIDARDNSVIGAEALVRWNSPEHGMISPGRFIPIAESSNLIVELDRYVMKTAINDFGNWYRQGMVPGVLSMNLSVKQLQQNDFLAEVVSFACESDIDPKYLELEVTEGQIMEDPEEAIAMLHSLNEVGINLALDDFGTGYSSLAYLKRLPISKLKIDQSFVRGLPDDQEDAAISRALVALANSLGLDLLAEGAENLGQVEFLRALGCNKFQGYYYGRPMPAADFEAYLVEYSTKAESIGSEQSVVG